MKRLHLFFLTFFSLYTIAIQSQNSAINWTTDSESLPQNSIKSIAPDKYGFIWLTTENGLARYDGKEFKVFNNRNLSVKNNRFIYISGDYHSDSLYTFNDHFEDYLLINKRDAKTIALPKHLKEKISKDNTYPTTYVASSNYQSKPFNPYKIHLFKSGYYFIEKQAVQLVSKKGRSLYKIPFKYASEGIFFILNETLFCLKDETYFIFNNGKIQEGKLDLKVNKSYRLYWNPVSRQAFILTGNDLYSLRFKNGKLISELIIKNEDLIAYDVGSIYYDDKNDITYLGSTKNGLGIYQPKLFTTVMPGNSNNSEAYDVFYAMQPFSDTTVISATGIIMTNQKLVKNLKFQSDKYDISIDKNKDIWTSDGGTLNRHSKKSNYQHTEKWNFSDIISTTFVDRNGSIWFDLSHNQDTKGSIYNFLPKEKPVFRKVADTNFKINYFAQDESGIIWLGTKKGLYKFNTKTEKITQIKGTENLKIRNIHISGKNEIWLLTYENGFHLFKNNKLYSFPTDKNNYLLSSHSIAEDGNGFFWIPTNKGLFLVKKSALLAYAEKKTNEVYYHYYNKNRGFLSNEFNGGCQPANAQLKNGDLFLPSINGVVVFNPAKIKPILPDNAIFIDYAIIDTHKKIKTGDTLRLNRNFERITFSINSPYYGNPANLNFEARLDGPEVQNWMPIAKENTVSFTKLIPGIYTLTFRKLSGFDSKYTYKTIKIIVDPAFWQTVWFKIFMLFIITLLMLVSYNLRTKYIRDRNMLLQKKINEQTVDLKNTISALRTTKDNLNRQISNNTKIIQYITHDIKSPLRFMSMASKIMYDSYEENSLDLKENIQSIYTSSTQMYNFVENLLEYSKTYLESGEVKVKPYPLQSIINEKIALFAGIANSQKTAIKNLIPTEILLKTNKHLFSIIIHNLIDNAVKNTSYGSIVFTCYNEEEKLHISISDTGNGMDEFTLQSYRQLVENYDVQKNKVPEKMGLRMVIELLIILNGKMTIQSKAGKGTTVTLIFENRELSL